MKREKTKESFANVRKMENGIARKTQKTLALLDGTGMAPGHRRDWAVAERLSAQSVVEGPSASATKSATFGSHHKTVKAFWAKILCKCENAIQAID